MTMPDRLKAGTSTGALTPGGVHRAISGALASAGLGEMWVVGTVASLRAGPRFTSCELVEYGDDGTTVSETLAVGMFAREARHVIAKLRSAGAVLEDGLEVRFRGRLDVNGRFGNVRLLVDDVDPRTTIGAAAVARQHLLARLESSGLASAQSRLRVGDAPRRVGLVTAAGGAGRADVLQIVAESGHPLTLVEEQVAMSGVAAPGAVAAAVERVARRGVDLVLLARGGGSRSDLSAWDSPEVAQAIVRCRVPVWVAVGHAIDRSVADAVANQSFPTPSAAAAALVALADGQRNRVAVDGRERERERELLRARRRAQIAICVAVVALLILVGVLL